ncbi:MAG: DUF5312 family protein [Spirochaetaceae bacterium]|jgi:uncharacterized protein (DUF2164 family)|nr:DUF5312 family protein [Spirochaetaceae bacterium]
MSLNTFEKLSIQLTDEERQLMLQRLRDFLPQEEPLLVEDEDIFQIDIKKVFEESPWYQKLFYNILQLFTGKDVLVLVEERELRLLSRSVRREAGYYIDIEAQRVKQDFLELIQDLKNRLMPFAEPLQRIRSEREDFVVFLGNRFFNDFADSIFKSTDPQLLFKDKDNPRMAQIKSLMQETFETLISSIDQKQRNQFKQHARSIHLLQSLQEFPFYNFIGAFSEQGPTGQEAPWENLSNAMVSLVNILYSMKLFPNAVLLENLFIYGYQERFTDSLAEDLGHWMKELYQQALSLMDLLENIDHLPLINMSKLINGDINFKPMDVGGGEDYFHIYRRYWQKKIDHRYAIFVTHNKIDELKRALLSTWGDNHLKPVGRYNHKFGKYCRFRYVVTMELLVNFLDDLVMEKNYPLMDIIWKRGEFYKKENRRDYNEVMEYLQQNKALLEIFTGKLEDQGYYAQALQDILKQKEKLEETRQRDLTLLYRSIDLEVQGFIKQTLVILDKAGKLLTGVLMGDRGEYDTLSNYPDLAGPPNRLFKDELVTREFLVNNAHRNIQDIFALEEKAPI